MAVEQQKGDGGMMDTTTATTTTETITLEPKEIVIPKHVVDILNQRFGEDVDNLAYADAFLEEYKLKENVLAKAIEESEKKSSDDLIQVMGSCKEMMKDIVDINSKIEDIVKQYSFNNNKSSKMEEHMKGLHKNVADLENEQAYAKMVKEIKDLFTDVDTYVQKKNMSAAITSYNKLHKIWSELLPTTCTNLHNFLNNNCENLFLNLKETLFKELNALLTSMKYPFPTGISSPHFNKKEDTEEQFKKNLHALLKLKPLSSSSKGGLVTELFTAPLVKRFHFHFYGERHTNNPEKPEWYFTQVVNWIRDHISFLSDYIQPIINENLSVPFNIDEEFSKILVNLVQDKLQDTISVVCSKDIMLAHLIDETIVFENELHSIIQLSDTPDVVVHILLKDDVLNLWLHLEEKFTNDSMNARLEHEEAWIPKFSELTLTDKNLMYYVPRSVEEFISFLSLMNNRHKNLNNINAQKKFFDILLTSLHHFVTKMKDIASVEMKYPESQNYCSILNGAYYLFHVLEEWTEDMYFMELFASAEFPVQPNNRDTDNDVNLEKSVFEDIQISLDRFIISLVESIVDNLRVGLKSKLNLYKSETWQALPPLKDYVVPTLSSGACDIMLFIKEHLHLLEEKLCPDIFNRVWKQATYMIDNLIFKEVVYESHFNEGGASQLQFDLKENLFILFGQYTPRADSYFKLLKDACVILNLPTGTAYLLKEVLDQKKKLDYDNLVKTALNDVGVKYFTEAQANRLINSRIDYWPRLS